MTFRHRLQAGLITLLLLCYAAPAAFAQTNAQAPGNASTAASPQTSAPASPEAAREALIQLLQDPKGRSALIDLLKQEGTTSPANGVMPEVTVETNSTPAEKQDSSAAATTPDEDGTATDREPFAVWLGAKTRLIADDLSDNLNLIGRSLNGVVLLATGEVQIRWDRAQSAALEVAVVLITALLVFYAGQHVLKFALKKYVSRAGYGGWIKRTVLLLLVTLADGLTVVIGWGAGYAAAIAVFKDSQNAGFLLQSLALNAFVLTGLAKVILRTVFAPNRAPLRILPFSDETAGIWSRHLGFVTSLLGYGLMLGVPVANLTISFVLGNAVRVLVVLAATLYLMITVHRQHERVAKGIRTYSERMSSDILQQTLRALAGFWHLIAYLYVLVVLGIWLSRPFDAVTIIVQATGLSLLTVFGGFMLSFAMTRAIVGGIRVPANVRESLPALESRLNTFVPYLLKLFRFLVFVGTLLILADIWGAIGLFEWVNSTTGREILDRYSSALLVVLVSFVVWLAVMSWIDLRLRSHSGYVVTARVRTLFQLFRNAFTVVMIVMGALLCLSEVGVDIGPLIAGAGVVGLAISFGAQTLVKDIITGAFIQIENAINEGDVVTVGGITGAVEHLTVRSVRLRDVDGTTHIVPFSAVDTVSNFMRDFSYHVALIGVSYDTDIRKAKAAMEEAFERLRNTEAGKDIIADLEMHGVTSFGDSAVNIRARIKTLPGSQWGIGRAYNEHIKDVFDEQGIEIPFPQVTYHSANPAIVEELEKTTSRDKDEPNDRPAKDSPNENDADADAGEADSDDAPR
ncbi:mechanosensitive ion channel domain-containing protein [Roseibium litorale]|uniref:Mechanosensitive ion channel n=1 Tax=Roseibium litorale TaxID=2803841 RepID=A0ABR9CU05_9HYPH|nr:mechanosensitive ion channel domain-containing protein [Roseibium litorale]MBD8893771.1 mechanosensitive ion channel [Roseibium litorale]